MLYLFVTEILFIVIYYTLYLNPKCFMMFCQ